MTEGTGVTIQDDEDPIENVSDSEPEIIEVDDGSAKEITNSEDGDDVNNDSDGNGDKDDDNEDDNNNDDDDAGSTDEVNDNRSKEEKDKEAKEKEKAEKKRIEELKEKYKDWPLQNIKEPHENDVMYGRGGGTNHHKGNKEYRKMVEDRKLEYVNSKRLDKPLVALEIIRIWRAKLPPGRFLKQNEKTGNWDDVGDKKAREKTSQALREKAPQIRKKQEEDQKGEGGSDKDESKTTRFAEGTKNGKKSSSKVKRAILARDHSLGREYLASDEAISINNFTWQDPFKGGKRETSTGSITTPQQIQKSGQPSEVPVVNVVPRGRINSQGSVGMAPPYIHGGPIQHPPPPDYYGSVSVREPSREFSNSSLGSWGAVPYPHYPQPGGPFMLQRSGSWTHPPPPPSPQHGAHHQRSGSWGGGGGGRMNSLGFNPLPGANTERAADLGAFENTARTGSGYYRAPPPPPPGAYSGYSMSGGSIATLQGPYRQNPSPSHSTPSPPYNVMNIARTWSGGEPQRTWSVEHAPPPMGNSQFEGHPRPVAGADTSPSRNDNANQSNHIPRPTMVKRDTSNQNESYETKPCIKRAALNRDQSATSNRLKKEYMPDYFDKDMNKEMLTLQEDTEQIRLSPNPKPQSLKPDGRVSTIDVILNDLMTKPPPMLGGDRVSTIDALGLDDSADLKFNTDDSRFVGEGNQTSKQKSASIPKPGVLTQENRLTTTELFQVVDLSGGPLPI